jgi:hypothetical protein
MDKMIVEKIEIMDYDTREYLVVITDGTYRLNCFSHYNQLDVDELDGYALMAIELENVMKADNQECFMIQEEGVFKCKVQGILDNGKSQLLIGAISIDISACHIPKDLNEGDYVAAEISRVDII